MSSQRFATQRVTKAQRASRLPVALPLAIIALTFVAGQPTIAQAPQDVPQSHWAYSAVSDLAAKGLIQGYPAEGRFFGGRQVTRYEMATIVQRVLHRIEELIAANPPKPGVSPQQLEEVKSLIDEFKVELTVIGTDLVKAKSEIASLRTEVGELRKQLSTQAQENQQTRRTADEAKARADAASKAAADIRQVFETFESDYKKKHLFGYMQVRFDAFDSGGPLFPSVSTTGGPTPGGAQEGFLVRRARLSYAGDLGKKTDFHLQLDAPSASSVSLVDAFIDLKDALAQNVTVRAGQFGLPFGTELPTSSRLRVSPERAISVGDNKFATVFFKNQVSLFYQQDRDTGVAAIWDIPNHKSSAVRLTLGAFNGEGHSATGQRNLNNTIDGLARIAATGFHRRLEWGVSAYSGLIEVPNSAGGAGAITNAQRFLIGTDIQYTAPWGTYFHVEYVNGLYETNTDRSDYVKGNHATGLLASVRHPLSKRLELGLRYENLNPTLNTIKIGGVTYNRSQLNRELIHVGLLYAISGTTRLRLWYTKSLTPYDVTATSGAGKDRLGLISTEVQIDYR